MLAWHVATTLPFSELTAEREIAKRGLQAFNPKCEIAKTIRNREQITRMPYFSGYVFINFDVEQDDWEIINTRRGVRQLIYASPGRPAKVHPEAMKFLLEKCNGDCVGAEHVDRALSRLIPIGTEAKITGGPFMGYSGTVKWQQGDRIKLLMHILGTEQSIKFQTKQIEVVS